MHRTPALVCVGITSGTEGERACSTDYYTTIVTELV